MSRAPPTLPNTPDAADRYATLLSIKPLRQYVAAPVRAVGMVTGSVVPSAIPGEASRMSLMAGVEMPAPPTPNIPARNAEKKPISIAKKTYTGPGLALRAYYGCSKRYHIIVGRRTAVTEGEREMADHPVRRLFHRLATSKPLNRISMFLLQTVVGKYRGTLLPRDALDGMFEIATLISHWRLTPLSL